MIAEFGTAAVIVEQDVQRALDISDRGYTFVSGNVAFHGKADDIVTDERIRNAYLGGCTQLLHLVVDSTQTYSEQHETMGL